MKVVSQLARHFWNTNSLSFDEADYLVSCGLVPARELQGFDAVKQNKASGIEVAAQTDQPRDRDEFDHIQERLIQSNRRCTKKHHERNDPSRSDELLRLIRDELERRLGLEEALQPIAQRIATVCNSQSALKIARNASQTEFVGAFLDALDFRSSQWFDLWRLLDVNYFLHLFDSPNYSSPLSQALKVVAALNRPRNYGSYGWVLCFEEARKFVAMQNVNRKLMAGIFELLQGNSNLLTRYPLKGCDRLQFWTLILLYNMKLKDQQDLDDPRFAVNPSHEFEIPCERIPDRDELAQSVQIAKEIAPSSRQWFEQLQIRTLKYGLRCPNCWQLPR